MDESLRVSQAIARLPCCHGRKCALGPLSAHHPRKKLNKTLESETSDLAQKLHAVINDLDTDGAIVELLPDMPAATEASDLDADIADRDQQVRGTPDDKQDKPGSLRWLQKKERRRRED